MTVGFTAGIATIILVSQVKELLGLTLTGVEPGPLLEKLEAFWAAFPTIDPVTLSVSLATIAVMLGLRKFQPHLPGLLIAVAGAGALTAAFDLQVATIGTNFGGIPSSLPMPSLPEISAAKIQAVLPSAIAFALLGSIESLLSAVVADGMTGRRHRSNCELVGQGIANLASGLFGGFCVTGTIARTATNVRSGAHGPIAGMLHAVFILLFVLFAAPLARFIPLASLAGVLVVVAWTMIEKQAVSTLLRSSRGDATVLLVTFLLTIFRDLTEAIVVGSALGSMLFIYRMSSATTVETHMPVVDEDKPDDSNGYRTSYDEKSATDPNVVVYRITGAFFFGAAASIATVLDRISNTHRALVIDFKAVPFLDSTGAKTIEGLAHKANRQGTKVLLTGTSRDIRQELITHGLKPPLVSYDRSIDAALQKLRRVRSSGN